MGNTMDYKTTLGGTNRRPYTPTRDQYSSFEDVLTRFNITRYHRDGQIDVHSSNSDRLHLAMEKLPPLMMQGSVLYYRHMNKAENGLWQVEYRISRPVILAPISEREHVALDAAIAFLKIGEERIEEMIRKKELRRDRGKRINFANLLQHEPSS